MPGLRKTTQKLLPAVKTARTGILGKRNNTALVEHGCGSENTGGNGQADRAVSRRG